MVSAMETEIHLSLGVIVMEVNGGKMEWDAIN